MSHWSVIVKTNMSVDAEQRKGHSIGGVHLVVGVDTPFVLSEGEEVRRCLLVLHVGQLL